MSIPARRLERIESVIGTPPACEACNDGRQIVVLCECEPEPRCPACGLGPRAEPIRVIVVPCDHEEARS